MVQEHRGEYPSLWAAVESIAPEIGCVPQTPLARRHLDDLRSGCAWPVWNRVFSSLTNAPSRAAPDVRIAAAAITLAIALPWLNPFAAGPSAGVQPLLFSWGCCGVLALFAARRGRFAVALAVAAAGMGVAAWAAAAHGPLALREWLPWFGAALAVAICAGIGRQAWFQHAVVLALLAAALLSSVIGLLQYFGQAGDFYPWLNVAPAGEAFGNLRQRNQLASLLNIGVVALLWWLAQPTKAAWRLLAVPAAVLLALGNAATASRGGFVQLLLVAALAGWWQWQPRQRGGATTEGTGWLGGRCVLLPALVAYVLGALLLPTLAGLDPNLYGPFARLAHGAQPCASRIVLWRNVGELIALKPWAGWGLNELDYAHFTHLYAGPRFCDILDNAHNLPLQLAVELGVPVALLVCGALLLLVLRARPWRSSDAAQQFAWSVLAIIGLHSLLEYPLWYGPFQMAGGLALGLLLAQRQTASAPMDLLSKQPMALILRAFTAITIVAMCGLAAYDYSRVRQIYLPPEQRSPELRTNPVEQLSRAVTLYPNPVLFARLTLTPLTQTNAAELHALAARLLHFSPEPRVAERLIDSARLLGLSDEARLDQARFKAAFAKEEAAWAAASKPAVAAQPAR